MNTPTDPPTHNSSAPAPNHGRGGLFRTADGTSHLTTFLLVCCLFCLSGLCNGMIDVLNKHFQNTLNSDKSLGQRIV